MGVEAEETACYAEKKLKELEAEIQQDLWVMRAPASLAVCFKRPSDRQYFKEIQSFWSLVVH